VCGSPVAHVVDSVCGDVVVKVKDGAVLLNVQRWDAMWLLKLASSEELGGSCSLNL
jgi:hypothetical protein